MFSWSNNNNRGAVSGHSRPEHISSYLNDPTLKPSTRKTSRDDSTYDTIFQTKNSDTLLIRVHVPPQLNSVKYCPLPIMTLVGIEATHPWLNDHMTVVGYGPISSEAEFQKSRLLLSQIVNAVVQHFQLNPPTNLRITDQSLQKMQPTQRNSLQNSIAAGARNNHQSMNQSQTHYSPPPRPRDVSEIHFSELVDLDASDKQQISDMMRNYPMPSAPTSIPEVSVMSTEEMSELMNDTNKLIPILEQNFFVGKIEEIKNTLRSANHVTATTNLTKKEYLHELHDEVTNLQKSLKEKVEKFNALKERQLELCKPVSNELVLKKLNKAKKQSMNESDDLAYKWLDVSSADDGAAQVDNFIDEFLEKRIVHHVRAAKVERIEA